MTLGGVQHYSALPEAAKQAVLALSVLIERIGALPKDDRNDLFELGKELFATDDPEERADIQRAMEEILAQGPVRLQTMPMPERPGSLHEGLRRWAEHAGGRIKELREMSGLTQTQLAEKAGLGQSHVSRLEKGEHSPSHLTVRKIADALGVDVKEIDPSC